MNLLTVENLKKLYKSSNTLALKNVSFEVQEKEFVAIMGESGSGKSTLLNIIATLDKPTEGTVVIANQNIEKLSPSQIATFRREKLGFVFQDFNLIETFSVKDNILLPLVLSGVDIDTFDSKLDYGGQKQRVAIARSLITSPKLILADEPTGQLDSKSAENVMQIFSSINDDGNTILMVTHSIKSASYAKRVLFIKDGIIFHEIYKGAQTNIDFAEKIADSLTLLNRRGE